MSARGNIEIFLFCVVKASWQIAHSWDVTNTIRVKASVCMRVLATAAMRKSESCTHIHKGKQNFNCDARIARRKETILFSHAPATKSWKRWEIALHKNLVKCSIYHFELKNKRRWIHEKKVKSCSITFCFLFFGKLMLPPEKTVRRTTRLQSKSAEAVIVRIEFSPQKFRFVVSFIRVDSRLISLYLSDFFQRWTGKFFHIFPLSICGFFIMHYFNCIWFAESTTFGPQNELAKMCFFCSKTKWCDFRHESISGFILYRKKKIRSTCSSHAPYNFPFDFWQLENACI